MKKSSEITEDHSFTKIYSVLGKEKYFQSLYAFRFVNSGVVPLTRGRVWRILV